MKKTPFLTLEKAQEIKAQIPTPFHIYDEAGIWLIFLTTLVKFPEINGVRLPTSNTLMLESTFPRRNTTLLEERPLGKLTQIILE